jgi:hypothetical protein
VYNALSDGRRFRALAVIDEFSRECLAIEVGASLTEPLQHPVTRSPGLRGTSQP